MAKGDSLSENKNKSADYRERTKYVFSITKQNGHKSVPKYN